jgi:hypothetical protein
MSARAQAGEAQDGFGPYRLFTARKHGEIP